MIPNPIQVRLESRVVCILRFLSPGPCPRLSLGLGPSLFLAPNSLLVEFDCRNCRLSLAQLLRFLWKRQRFQFGQCLIELVLRVRAIL